MNQNIVRETREWTAPNGHTVTLNIVANRVYRGTINGRSDHFARVSYTCGCGKELTYSGSPRKAHMDDHDTVWIDPTDPAVIARRELINKMLFA